MNPQTGDMAVAWPIRAAIVGAGNMAREHARAFGDVPGVVVAGIHSRTRSRAEALATEFGISHVCDSVAELYEKTRAELVVVSVPVLVTKDVSRSCFRFPWTVLLEKPPGRDLAEAEEIAAAAHDSQRSVFAALNRRFYSSTRVTLQELGEADGPRHINIYDQQDMQQAAALGHPPEVVGRWMYANSIHLLDYVRVFGRGPISAVTPVLPWEPRAPGIVVARVTFAQGDTAIYQAVWRGPGPWAVVVTTPGRRWEMRPLERLVRQNAGDRRLTEIETHPWDRTFKPGLRLQAQNAVAAARGEESLSVPLDEALETMRLVSTIYGLQGA